MLIEKRSISGVIGKGGLYHNNRRFVAENVDKSRIADNITIISENVKTVYHELFDEALAEYNSKQKRKDRIIKDYHDHIRHSRQEKEFDFLTLHSLRHCNATLLLNSGVDLKVVSDHLGHCDIGVTANIYADVLKSTKSKVSDLVSLKLA